MTSLKLVKIGNYRKSSHDIRKKLGAIRHFLRDTLSFSTIFDISQFYDILRGLPNSIRALLVLVLLISTSAGRDYDYDDDDYSDLFFVKPSSNRRKVVMTSRDQVDPHCPSPSLMGQFRPRPVRILVYYLYLVLFHICLKLFVHLSYVKGTYR